MILSCGRFLPFSWPRDEVSRCRCSAVVAAGSRADCGVAMAALPLRHSPGAVEARIGASRHRLGGMARPNEQVAALLHEYADLIAITGGEQFKARVYEKAARSVGGHPQDIAELDAGELRKIPNVGASIAEKIVEYLRHGRIDALEELRGRIPAGVRQLMQIPTLGPKRAMILYEELQIASVPELADAI